MSCGVGDYTARLAEGLTRLGLKTTIATSVDPRVVPGDGYLVTQVAEHWGIRELVRILRMVRLTRPDVVHLQYPSAGFRHGLAAGLLLPALRVINPGIPVILTVHEYRHMHPLHRMFVAAMIPWAHALITPDASQVAALPSFVRRRFVEIPVASSVAAIVDDDVQHDPANELVIGTWGMVRHDKGIDLAIEAFEMVAAQRPARLIIAGDPGPDLPAIEEIRRRIAASPFAGKITQTGRLLQPALGHVLRSFDVCVLPYRNGLEPNRGTYAAAVAAGVYTVTTSTESSGYEPATNTYFASPADTMGLVEGMLQAPKHPKRPPRDPARDWDAIAEAHRDVYSGLLHVFG